MRVRLKVPETLTLVGGSGAHMPTIVACEDMHGFSIKIRDGDQSAEITLDEEQVRRLVARANKYLREQR